ncbi:molybdate ABC transporter substrate-binding protein [Dyadobacter sandarakinus]|uniref:Molybdate ABC transporter substrate-binding protein n=1 Tax=Dyadobacter sandarakinus TaxID=2747268 RepID=A0ABX7I7L2_9BACT|nr:molybdate ABC transporter substrate-binding protein [Dyadobacter sandarakinus]QRR02087.1 molybdate ABC transporter substrate-binding protein [Dyadobacter sandarakinus]
MQFLRPLTFLLFILLAGCSKPSDKIIVATAANVQYVMKEIQAEFEKGSTDSIHIVVASSGKLTSQIREGAPFDVFVSADTRYPEEIFKNGGAEEKPKVYASGTLILWSKNISENELTLAMLADEKIRKIAIPNPETAPYGRAAIEALKAANVFEKVKSKLVYGESIAQTAQYITSGSVEAGFNALSIVLAPETKQKGNYTIISDSLHHPIQQAALLLKHTNTSPKKSISEKFYNFLYSEKAKAIFRKYGYR